MPTTTNQRDTTAEALKKVGVRSKAYSQKAYRYVGASSGKSFRDQTQSMADKITPGSPDVATLGEFYNSPAYRQESGSQEKTYENVFETTDWEIAAAQDPNTKLALDEFYGNNDKDPSGTGGEVTQTELQEVLGEGSTEKALRSLKEKAESLTESQNGIDPIRDETTRGIRGALDVGAEIEPIA